ncbi:amidohydrolase family protein [Variovorax terrae]|uniref:Amidohydrolase family protein n=1 Tax=Variovorax terrae TaxID=2923278 RepID=A0A9X1VV49_9BURK|nr:amidohydrolase family protein [Variovorax terrae]MCJ0762584.1 amidohydrolase family protein [Variovorax terrae]
MSHEILVSSPMRAPSSLTPPAFGMPAGACDAHVHVFGPAEPYPHVPQPHYTLPDGNLRQLQAMCGALDLQRFVIVQPSFYGTDNRCMLDALDAAGDMARGVAMVDDDVSDEALQTMHARGVRALRLDLFLRASLPLAERVAYIQRSIRRVQPLGWHVQFYTPGWVVRELIPYIADFEVDFVVDHMGYMLESDGLTRADFDQLVEAMQRGRGWMKLSGPYRVAKDLNYAKLQPLAETIIAALPGRVIWGSDWPHIPEGGRDTGELLNLLAAWAPDAAVREQILSANPARLFGWQGA